MKSQNVIKVSKASDEQSAKTFDIPPQLTIPKMPQVKTPKSIV